MHGLSPTRWRQIAIRTAPGEWTWTPGFTPDACHMAQSVDEIVMMTKGAELLACIAGPRWKRTRRQMKHGQFWWGPRIIKEAA